MPTNNPKPAAQDEPPHMFITITPGGTPRTVYLGFRWGNEMVGAEFYERCSVEQVARALSSISEQLLKKPPVASGGAKEPIEEGEIRQVGGVDQDRDGDPPFRG